MKVPIRETGSILVRARKDEVLDILRRHVQGASMVAPDRLVAGAGTYVLREAGDGTHVFHARSDDALVPFGRRPREDLRMAVQSDLFELQRLVEANRR